MNIVENESVSISNEIAIASNNIYLVILSSLKMSCTVSSHQKLIFTVMQMQVMHFAVDMNCNIGHTYTT